MKYLGRRRSNRDLTMPAGLLERVAPTVADPAIQHGDADRMRQALAGLPRRPRAVLVLRFYEELSDAEIAADMGCTVGTVRSHASRAPATLRDALKEETWTSTT